MSTGQAIDAPDRSAEPSAARSGTVFDIGYRSYTGVREGRRRSRSALLKDGTRIALGLGRGPRAKVLPWLFIGVLAAIGLIMALVAGAAERLAGPGAAEKAGLPSHSDLYGIASIVIFVFAAVVAPELLCRDRREGTINLYLVRPVTGTDYVASRWLSFFLVMTGAVLLPQCILWLGLSMGAAVPLDYIRANWLDVPHFLGGGLVMAAYVTTLALLVASFTSRRAYASVFLVGLFIITTPFTAGLSQEIDGNAGAWISMFNLTNIPVHVSDLLFGTTSEITEDAPALRLSGATRVAWCAAWILVPGLVLWARYRRMSP